MTAITAARDGGHGETTMPVNLPIHDQTLRSSLDKLPPTDDFGMGR